MLPLKWNCSNNLNATIAERAISAAQNTVSVRKAKQPFMDKAEKQAYFETSLDLAQSIQEDAPERVTVIEGTTPDQIEYEPHANSSAGQLITWVFIPLFGISALFAYELQQGTLRRLLTTPSHKATFLLGTILGQVAMALIQMPLLVVFGILVMKLNWDVSHWRCSSSCLHPLLPRRLDGCSARSGSPAGVCSYIFLQWES